MAATDERAIHEFPTGTIDDNSLLIMDRPTLTPGEYETEKFAIANLGLKLLGGIDFPNNLDTDEQDIFGAINEVNAKAMNIAREYNPNENWYKGDYCIHENITYICSITSGTTTGTFVPGDWTEVKALEEVKTNTGSINELNGEIGISDYNPNRTYYIGEYCRYNGVTYYCSVDSVTGTWDATKWNNTTVSNDLQNIVIRRTLTETTTANGNVINYIDVANGIVVSARCTSQEAIVTTFINSLGTHYSFHVVSPTANAQVVANTQVSIEFYMIPRRRVINA